MNQTIVLARNEPARLDRERLATLVAELGVEAAEAVVTRALEELAVRLADVEAGLCGADLARLRKNARGMAAIAEQLGMGQLARVALDVTRCVDSGDAVALAATRARLLRLGEGSLLAVWDDGGSGA